MLKQLAAVIPVRYANGCKARLAEVFSVTQRRELVAAMLQDMLTVLGSCREISGLALVADQLPAGLPTDNLHVLADPQQGLNAALTHAAGWCRGGGYRHLLVLHGDLPRLSAVELGRLFEHHEQRLEHSLQGAVTIVPDSRLQGTNALLMSPPEVHSFAFGEGSFARHCRLAEAVGADCQHLPLPGLGHDLDLPEDVLKLLESGVGFGSRTRAVLRSTDLMAGLSPAN